MMDEMEDIIIKYLNQTATEEEMKQLLNWLEQDSDNQQQFAVTRDLWLTSEASISLHYGESVKAFNTFRKNALAFEKRGKKKFFSIKLMKVAASIALLIACATIAFFSGRESAMNMPKIVNVMMNQAIMGPGHKGAVTLPDGTLAWLNSNSKLIYPDQFEGNVRKVKLIGEGYFEVKPDANAPFYVETSDMSVKVLGTHFDVRNYEQKNISETVLLSGKVEVMMKNSGEKRILSPNEKLSFDKRANNFTVDRVDAAEYALWTAEKLVFEDERLSTILRKMERWYGIEISCKQGVSLNSRYSLTIRNESKEEILKMLSILVRIDYTIKDDNIILYKI